ncbi:TetR/AcrR family transcriptional regulator [Paenibacillus methanolicus]|uniref:AcrR family transcriptional regulator n=1 Tax=Paenibacillus methanolicus TaxID=582686 RepID=A0A5S5C935_9BACL|nr:TetR/AcrR family transcriptional regulator [Paenibacillus methanolicus]TYP74493.1 AcrR family transcriptional regulator [Paenibacillus methanolicus]
MPVNENDPRVQRTRQLLMQAFMELLEEKKNIYSISVQDIAARATVNRATFYAHFADKFAFLESWMREKFQRKLSNELPNGSLSDMDGLRALMLSVFDFLARTRLYMTPGDRQFEPLFEIAMQKELDRLLLRWLRGLQQPSASPELVEATALFASWGIFGSAVQWSRAPRERTAESAVRDLLVVVAAGVKPVTG